MATLQAMTTKELKRLMADVDRAIRVQTIRLGGPNKDIVRFRAAIDTELYSRGA